MQMTKSVVGCSGCLVALLVVCLGVASAVQPCGFPGRPAYGRISLIRDSYEPGQSVAYSCDSGFNLLGHSSRQCLANGTWSGTLPVCDTSLSVQRIPEASGYLYAYPPVNALDGSKTSCFYTTYQPPRWWRVDLGAAYHVLSVALTVPHVSSRQDLEVRVVSYEGNKAVFNRCAAFSGKFSTQTVVLMCDEGKGIVGQYVDVADKRKDPDHFSLCEVEIYVLREKYQCGDPEKPPKSYTVPLSAQEMEYRCVSGYKLSGPTVRTCLETGQWSAAAPRCLEAACPSLGPLDNGKVAVRGTSNGRTVQGSQLIYTCDPGYTLEGNDTRTCLEDARWGGQQPHCQAVTCEMPGFEVDGGTYTLLNVSTNYGDLAELNCHLGYERQGGPTTIVCQEDGTWSPPQASCILREMKQKLKKQLPGAVSDTSSTLTGMVTAIIAIVFLFLLSMCILLILKKKKLLFEGQGGTTRQGSRHGADRQQWERQHLVHRQQWNHLPERGLLHGDTAQVFHAPEWRFHGRHAQQQPPHQRHRSPPPPTQQPPQDGDRPSQEPDAKSEELPLVQREHLRGDCVGVQRSETVLWGRHCYHSGTDSERQRHRRPFGVARHR